MMQWWCNILRQFATMMTSWPARISLPTGLASRGHRHRKPAALTTHFHAFSRDWSWKMPLFPVRHCLVPVLCPRKKEVCCASNADCQRRLRGTWRSRLRTIRKHRHKMGIYCCPRQYCIMSSFLQNGAKSSVHSCWFGIASSFVSTLQVTNLLTSSI